jgi:hypothetical protein
VINHYIYFEIRDRLRAHQNHFIMSSPISVTKAKAYIDHYRDGLAPGALRSAWIGRSFIDAILALEDTHQLDGVRVYLAKYNENDPDGRFSADNDTIIIVPTEGGIAGTGRDIESAYHDYSRLCPPYCDGDEG